MASDEQRPKPSPPRSRAAQAYARFRGSPTFVVVLTAFCAAWIFANLVSWLPHFDDSSFGLLTLILSIEASLSVALLIMDAAVQEEFQRKQMTYMLHMLEAIRDLMKVEEARVEETKKR